MSSKGKKRVSSSSSSLPVEGKRARIATMDSSPDVEEEEEEEYGEEDMDYDMSQLGTQDAQESRTKSQIRSDKVEADSGVIEKIQLTDFMCHRKLDVNLSSNVNFILGRNGSGKSAIMTAIVVALGGKATTTHRASSLKSFIRTGAKSAEVVIVLRNRGIESYKPAEYGDTIFIHRIIRDDGTTAYKIKGASGAVVSHKKEELVHILDHMNIQVDNPVSLLDQDTSRHFLHSNNPAHKYKLFIKATRLEQIQRDYDRAEEDQKLMQRSIERNEALSEDLKRQAKLLEEKLDMFNRLKEMEEKVNSLEMELQWVMVMELEKVVPPLEEQLQKEQSRIPRNQHNITKAEARVEELTKCLGSVNGALESVVREAGEINKRRTDKTLEKKRVEKAVREMKVKQRRGKSSIEEQSREKSALQQKMEDLVKLSQANTAGERARRQKEIQETEGELKQLKEQFGQMLTKKRNVEEAMKHIETQMRQLDSQRGQFTREIREGENKVRTLKSSRSNQLLTHGQWMPVLVKAIQDARSRFRRPPKGPIGAMIKLKDYCWSVSIEAIIGKDLSAFVVDNTYDRATLEQIISTVVRGHAPNVIVSRYTGRPYDVSQKRPPTPHPTVLDMMEVEDLEVRNVLIDQYNVDTVLLIKTRLDAEQVIEVERPRGARMAYTIEGDQIQAGRFYANKKRPLGIIQESVDRAIREEEDRLRELEAKRHELDSSERELHEEGRANKGVMMSVRRELDGTQSSIRQFEVRLKELHAAEEEEDTQEDIATYESEIQECDARIAEMMEQKSKQDNEMRELKSQLEACGTSLSSVEGEAERVASRMEEIKAQHSEYEHEIQKSENVLKHYRDRIKEIQNIIANLETRLSEAKKVAEQAAEEASKVCERIETRRSCKSIETEISKLKRHIQREEPHIDEKEAVAQEYTTKIDLYRKTMKSIREHKMALKELRKGLMLRMKNYGSFQDSITARACIYFKYFLQQRDYDGDLRFNHDEEKLGIEVRVDRHSHHSQATKNTKSLSGGERSFTTVCFIMSLWEAIEAPFRCLDEFDVFMDMVNRRISMQCMMDSALDQRGKQFIFLTPQDMSQMGVRMGPRVKVLKLHPPDRDQTTLD